MIIEFESGEVLHEANFMSIETDTSDVKICSTKLKYKKSIKDKKSIILVVFTS